MLKNKMCKCGKVAEMVQCSSVSSCKVSCNQRFSCKCGLKYWCLECYKQLVLDNTGTNYNMNIANYKWIESFEPFILLTGGYIQGLVIYKSWNKLYRIVNDKLVYFYADGENVGLDVAISRLQKDYKGRMYYLSEV